MRNWTKMHTRIRKAVLPVAGLGTRFLPATKAQPKEMLPIVDKPLVQYAVEEASRSGIKNIIFVIGTRKESIQHHFEQNSGLEQLLAEKGRDDLIAVLRSIGDLAQNIQYVHQWSPLGLGDAILKARTMVGDEPFAVLLPDDVIDAAVPCLKQMIDVHARYKHSVVAIQEVPPETVSSYGIIRANPSVTAVPRLVFTVSKTWLKSRNLRMLRPTLRSLAVTFLHQVFFLSLASRSQAPGGKSS